MDLHEAVIYLGPPLKDIVQPGAVFVNGLPPDLKKAQDACLSIGELIVPVSRAAEAMKQIGKAGSSLHVCYAEAGKYRKE